MVSSVYLLLKNHDFILFCDVPNLLQMNKAGLDISYWFLRMIWMIWCLFEIVTKICRCNTIPDGPFRCCSKFCYSYPKMIKHATESITDSCIRKMRLAIYLLIAVILLIFNYFSLLLVIVVESFCKFVIKFAVDTCCNFKTYEH